MKYIKNFKESRIGDRIEKLEDEVRNSLIYLMDKHQIFITVYNVHLLIQFSEPVKWKDIKEDIMQMYDFLQIENKLEHFSVTKLTKDSTSPLGVDTFIDIDDVSDDTVITLIAMYVTPR